jgi:hypothetical protein
MCILRGEPGEVSAATVGLRGTWRLPSASCGSMPRVRWLLDGGRLSRKAEFHTFWPGSGRVVTQTDVPGRWWWSAGNRSGVSSRSRGHMPLFRLWCLGWGWLLASMWSGRPQLGSMCSLLMLEGAPRGPCRCAEAGSMKCPTGVTVWWETSERWQAWQACVQVRQSFCMPGHMKRCATSFTVAFVPWCDRSWTDWNTWSHKGARIYGRGLPADVSR